MELSRKSLLLHSCCPVLVVLGAAVILVGLRDPILADPWPPPLCWSCYVELQLTYDCESPQGSSCNMYGCFGGSGQCRAGCVREMMSNGEECANIGCGWTQAACANMDCNCFDWE